MCVINQSSISPANSPQVFDSSDGSWYIHMSAASRILSRIKRSASSSQQISFLESWMKYHKVLAEFSHCSGSLPDMSMPNLPSEAEENTKVLSQTYGPFCRMCSYQSQIVGSLGCSMQVLECISCINQLSKITKGTQYHKMPLDIILLVEELQIQLEALRQAPAIIEVDTYSRIDQNKIHKTAELYRLAALIYLHRSVLSTPQVSPVMKKLVSKSISILTELEVCTSPWPLFLTACELLDDEQRVTILNVIEKMQTERRIANVETIRCIIEGVWKSTDLIGGSERVDWKTMIGDNERMPSFI